MKKRLFVVVAVILAMSLVFGACSNKAPDAPADPAPAPAPAPAAPADADDDWADSPEFTLILTNHDPDQSLAGQYCFAWADMVYQKSKGRIEVSVNNGGSLAGPPESLDKVRGGSVDIAWGLQSFYPGQFPLSDALGMAYLPYTSSVHASKVAMDIFENTTLLDSEYDDVKVILLRSNCDAPIITGSKKLGSADDMRGLTFRSSGTFSGEWLKALNAEAAGCPIGELAQNLSTGTFDGAMTDWHAVNSFQLYEVADFFADEQVLYNTYFFVMNLDAYNRLPADLQAVIDDCSGQNALAIMLDAWDNLTAEAKSKAVADGSEIYTLPPDEHAKLVAAADGVRDAWLASGDADAQAMYDAIIASINKF